jgi:hypothetical protein
MDLVLCQRRFCGTLLIRFIRVVRLVAGWDLVCVCRGGLCDSTAGQFVLKTCRLAEFAVGFRCLAVLQRGDADSGTGQFCGK